jgi:hypothetical protein
MFPSHVAICWMRRFAKVLPAVPANFLWSLSVLTVQFRSTRAAEYCVGVWILSRCMNGLWT